MMVMMMMMMIVSCLCSCRIKTDRLDPVPCHAAAADNRRNEPVVDGKEMQRHHSLAVLLPLYGAYLDAVRCTSPAWAARATAGRPKNASVSSA